MNRRWMVEISVIIHPLISHFILALLKLLHHRLSLSWSSWSADLLPPVTFLFPSLCKAAQCFVMHRWLCWVDPPAYSNVQHLDNIFATLLIFQMKMRKEQKKGRWKQVWDWMFGRINAESKIQPDKKKQFDVSNNFWLIFTTVNPLSVSVLNDMSTHPS